MGPWGTFLLCLALVWDSNLELPFSEALRLVPELQGGEERTLGRSVWVREAQCQGAVRVGSVQEACARR